MEEGKQGSIFGKKLHQERGITLVRAKLEHPEVLRTVSSVQNLETEKSMVQNG